MNTFTLFTTWVDTLHIPIDVLSRSAPTGMLTQGFRKSSSPGPADMLFRKKCNAILFL